MAVQGDCFTANKGTVESIITSSDVDKVINSAMITNRKNLTQQIVSSIKDVRQQIEDLSARVKNADAVFNSMFDDNVAGVVPAVGGKMEYDNLAELATALGEETGDFNVILGGAFELTDEPITFDTKANVNLDLNGHDVVLTGEQTIVAKGGTHLTIMGEGSLTRSNKTRSSDPHFVALVQGEGSSLTLEGCTISSDEDYTVIGAASGTTLTVNGGSITMPYEESTYSAIETAKVTSTITSAEVVGDVYAHDGANMTLDNVTIKNGMVVTNGAKTASTITMNNTNITGSKDHSALYLPAKNGEANTVKITGGTLSAGIGVLNLGSNVTLTDVTVNGVNSSSINCGDATYGAEKTHVQFPTAAVTNAIMNSGYNKAGSVTIESGTYTSVQNVSINNGIDGNGENTPAETGVTINGGSFYNKLPANVRGDLFETEADGKYVYTSEVPSVVVTAGTEPTYDIPAETFGSIEVKGNYVVGQLKKAEHIVANFPPEKQNGYYIYLNAEPWDGTEVRRKFNGEWGNFTPLSENGKFLIFAGSEKVEVTDIDVKGEDGTITTYHIEVKPE